VIALTLGLADLPAQGQPWRPQARTGTSCQRYRIASSRKPALHVQNFVENHQAIDTLSIYPVRMADVPAYALTEHAGLIGHGLGWPSTQLVPVVANPAQKCLGGRTVHPAKKRHSSIGHIEVSCQEEVL